TQCNLENTMIVVPTHKLLNEVAGKLEEHGVEYVKAGKRPTVPDPDREAKINALTNRGAYRAAREEIESYANHITYIKNKEQREFTVEEQAVCDYINSQRELSNTQIILATHEKMLHIKNRSIRTVIVDEDIMMDSVFNRGSINIKDIKQAIRLAVGIQDKAAREALIKTLESVKSIVEDSPMDIVMEMPIIDMDDKKQKEIDKLIASNYSSFEGNLIDFFNCDYYEKIEDDTIKFNSNRAAKVFAADRKYIILSATASEKLYELLCPGRVRFNDIGLVASTGTISQYAKKSYSRYDYRQNSEKFIHEVKEKTKDLPVITYKMLSNRRDINIAKIATEDGKDYPLYFGATAGIDGLKGKDIAIVGTPHLTNDEYLLTARCLGLKPKLAEQMMEYQRIFRNGYEFWFFTFEHEIMQEIQLWMIESELVQAVGRARALREDCEVIILSNLPLEVSNIIDI
ncbi:MAG TPA: hypothetical protein VD757_02565, partial [Candidatus Nitrosocosmicus sp.]|nr:hypothetical protein [Candidatus Nitrosocosmicus sp.]